MLDYNYNYSSAITITDLRGGAHDTRRANNSGSENRLDANESTRLTEPYLYNLKIEARAYH